MGVGGAGAGLPRLLRAGAGKPSADRRSKRPNILLILANDLGNRSLSCFGATVATPNLDRLVKGGMAFTCAHAAPMCAPTRDEMFTGLSRARIRGRPGAETPFFTNHLRTLGYATGMAGKWFVGKVFDPPLRGFHESLILVNGYRHWAPDVMAFGGRGMFKELNQPKVQGRLNEWEIPRDKDERHHATRLPDRYGEDAAVEFLCDFIERHKGGPFFAYYSSKLAHVPHAPTPDGEAKEITAYKAAFNRANDRDLKGLGAFARAEAKRRGARLKGKRYRNDAIAYLNKMVGRLIAKLDELDLRRDTVVVFASDNGNSGIDPLPDGAQCLPGRKGDCREGGTRIPLVAVWPGRVRAGSTCDDLVHVQDVGPTLLELAGGAWPEGVPCDGRSFAPQLLGRKGAPRRWYVGYGAHPNLWLKRVAKELGKPNLKRYRLVWVRGLRYKLYNDGRFYDLQEDLAETRRIPPGKGGAAAEAARKELSAVLGKYTKLRVVR